MEESANSTTSSLSNTNTSAQSALQETRRMESEQRATSVPPNIRSDYEIGAEVKALRRIGFKSGKSVETGDVGKIVKVPGTVEGSPAKVKVGECVFSIMPGDFELVRTADQPADTCRTVPVRLAHYVDYIGTWGDTLQKQRVQRLQKQLESAAGRLSEEAAAKFEEVAWLQNELEKWHAEAIEQSKRADSLQMILNGKDDEVARLLKQIEARESDIDWLKKELQRKAAECNAAAAEIARLEGKLANALEELKRLERVAQQKGNDETGRRRDLEKRYEDMRAAKQSLEDQLYAKMEELARAEQLIKQLEDSLRELSLAHERAKAEWQQELEAKMKLIESLQQQLASLRNTDQVGTRDAACQVHGSMTGQRHVAEDRIQDLEKKLYARESMIQQLETRLSGNDNLRKGLIDDLKNQISQRDEYIQTLEAGNSNNWRSAKSNDDQSRRIAELEAELRKLRLGLDDDSSAKNNAAASADRKLREAERMLRDAERRYKELERLKDLLENKLLGIQKLGEEKDGQIAALRQALQTAEANASASHHRLQQLEVIIAHLRELLPKVHESSIIRLLAPLRDALMLFPERNPFKSPTRQRPTQERTRSPIRCRSLQ